MPTSSVRGWGPDVVEEARASYLELIRLAIFGGDGNRRYTQDSPVLPNVWLAYGDEPWANHDLLLSPHRYANPGMLVSTIRDRARAFAGSDLPHDRQLTYNESYAVGRFTFGELVCVLLPLTPWYRTHALRGDVVNQPWSGDALVHLEGALRKPPGSEHDNGRVSSDLVWLTRIVGLIELARTYRPVLANPWSAGEVQPGTAPAAIVEAILEAAVTLYSHIPPPREEAQLWLVNTNRRGGLAVSRSRETIKADVAERAFAPDLKDVRWGIIDTGVDAQHPAFRARGPDGAPAPDPFTVKDGTAANHTRVVETYNFAALRRLMSLAPGDPAAEAMTAAQRTALGDLRTSLQAGRAVAWDLVRPLIRVPDDRYVAPVHEHGTHVAGILGADWRKAEQTGVPDPQDVRGVCPTIQLYDFRVTDDRGSCDEFSVIAALQFARWLNAQSDRPVLHGVNISISMIGEVENYACGRTPVCEECERLVNSGVVTVVAAGNGGYEAPDPYLRPFGLFHDISVTDPGNGDAVITVGATHRLHPHNYGVSYFSSRGPTADGRMKPDLVAPGEKIVAPVPDCKLKALDGTSMAAPHVSGAAAILMARYKELVGQPARVKRILMDSATDLGRERRFQGAGLVDIFRALHSV